MVTSLDPVQQGQRADADGESELGVFPTPFLPHSQPPGLETQMQRPGPSLPGSRAIHVPFLQACVQAPAGRMPLVQGALQSWQRAGNERFERAPSTSRAPEHPTAPAFTRDTAQARLRTPRHHGAKPAGSNNRSLSPTLPARPALLRSANGMNGI